MDTRIIVAIVITVIVFAVLGLWGLSEALDKTIKHYIDYSKPPRATREQIRAKLLEAGYSETGADRVLDSEAPVIAEMLWGGQSPKEKDDDRPRRT